MRDDLARWRPPAYPRERARAHAQLVALAGAGRGRWAVDVGAGDGTLGFALARNGWCVLAIDVRKPADVLARMEAPPIAGGRLGLVAFSASMHYSEDLAATLARWSTALAPTGRMLACLSPVHATKDGARAGAMPTRRAIARAGAPNLAAAYRHITYADLELACRAARIELRVHAASHTVPFALMRAAKRLVTGDRMARFPILEMSRAPTPERSPRSSPPAAILP